MELTPPVGIGDLLHLKQKHIALNLDISKIRVSKSVIQAFRKNPEKTIEFLKYFLPKLFPTTKLEWVNSNINDITQEKINFTNLYSSYSFETSPPEEIKSYGNYIIFHTKCRLQENHKYDQHISYIKDFMNQFETDYTILIMGEREIEDNIETRIHKIVSLYPYLMQLQKKNKVIDLTCHQLCSGNDILLFEKDIHIIHHAKMNILIGLGGPLGLTYSFSNNLTLLTCDYRGHFNFFIENLKNTFPHIYSEPMSFIQFLEKDFGKPPKRNICIYQPYLTPYKKSALDAIESEWISNHGKYISLATNQLKETLQVNHVIPVGNNMNLHVILMANGTCATHCLFVALKYKYPHIQKIYVPNNCYVAVYNCVLMEYEKQNIEVLKINETSWNMLEDEEYLLSLEPNSAIVIVHNLGGIVDVDRIKNIRPDLILVEDNCEGLFGKYNGKYTGTSPNVLCSSISFYGNKTITTGEGGAFITNDEEVYQYIKKVYSQGMSSVRYVHDTHAYNYRMTNIQSAFLYDQLNDLETILGMKRCVFEMYQNGLKGLIEEGKIRLQQVNENCERANWMFAIEFVNLELSIEECHQYFYEENGIEIRPFFYPIQSHHHLSDIYVEENEKKKSEKMNHSIVMFPSYPTLKRDDIEYILYKIGKFVQKYEN